MNDFLLSVKQLGSAINWVAIILLCFNSFIYLFAWRAERIIITLDHTFANLSNYDLIFFK